MFRYLRQLASESLVYGLSGVLVRFLTIFLVPIYTRIFVPEDYGVMSLVTSSMALLSIFVVLGLDNAAHRWYWDSEESADRKSTLASWTWCQIALSSFFAVLLFVSAKSLSQLVVRRSDAALYFRLAGAALPISVLGTVVTNWLRMQRRPWATTIFSLGTTLLNILFTIIFVVFLHQGIKGVFTAQLISATCGLVVAVYLMRDWVNPRWVRWERLREMLRYALPLIPAALAFWVVSLSDRYFVNFYTSTREVGLYAVGSSIAGLIALGTGAFQQAWGPFAFSIHKQPDAKQVYAHVLLVYLWITCAVSTALQLLAPEAIRLVATEKYLGASPVVGLLALGYVMVGLQYVAAIGPAVVKDNRPTATAAMVGAGLNIVANLLLVPPLGKSGSAIATVLSQAAVAGYLFYRAQKLYPIPYRFGPAAGTVGLALALMGLGYGLHFGRQWWGVCAKLGLLALFVPSLFVLRIVTVAQFRHVVSPKGDD
jgi:O-antigen/teichoic acid export membrane protein